MNHDAPNPPYGAEFAAYYDRKTAETMGYAPYFVTAILLLIAVLRGETFFYIAAAVTTLFGVYCGPYLSKGAPLRMDAKGLHLKGLSVIPWTAIQSVELKTTHVRSIQIAKLAVKLTGAVQEEARPDALSRLQSRIWRKVAADELRINLSILNERPDDIYAAAMTFTVRA